MTVTITDRHLQPHPDLSLTMREAGTGQPILVLHGRAGPASVTPIIEHLAATHHVLAPTARGRLRA